LSYLVLIGVSMVSAGGWADEAADILNAEAPIEVSAAPDRFDLIAVDSARHRLIAAHSQASALTVVDLVEHKLLADISVGSKSSGVANDAVGNKYFVGTARGIAVIDPSTLREVAFIATPGPTDALAFDGHDDQLYVAHDDGKELWVVDPRQGKITGRIGVPGAPELMEIDPQSHRLYVNIKPQNEVAVIDMSARKIVAQWSTLPTESPHGLALDLQNQRMFIAGRSRMVSVFSLPTGVQQEAIDIGPGHVDQIALDAGARQLYLPSGARLVVVNVAGRSGIVVGAVAVPEGTHSVAVEPETHRVWIAYVEGGHSYVQAFAPVAVAKAQGPAISR